MSECLRNNNAVRGDSRERPYHPLVYLIKNLGAGYTEATK